MFIFNEYLVTPLVLVTLKSVLKYKLLKENISIFILILFFIVFNYKHIKDMYRIIFYKIFLYFEYLFPPTSF